VITATILYPVARGQDGETVHIETWERGQVVTCFGCGQELVGRLPHDGIKPTAHFAHRADVVAACSGETALHKAAKSAIVHAHARGALQSLAWECPLCRRCRHLTDLRSLALRAEARPCEGVVSDVLGEDSAGEPRVAIEVVVTHDLEAETSERYRARGIRVFVLRPSWGIVGDLVRGVDPLLVDHRAGLVDASSCEGCQQVLRERAEWAARERRQKISAWWAAWGEAWRGASREAHIACRLRTEEDRARHLRVETWWKAWSGSWRRTAEHVVGSWWIEWQRSWREVGGQYARPYSWHRDWRSAWGAVGDQHALEEARIDKLRAEAAARERALRRDWWIAWIRVWPDIAQRESGVMAAWRPICRHCRQDLTADHRCP